MLQLCLKIRFKNLYSLIRQHYGPINVQTRSFSQLKAEPSCGLIRFSDQQFLSRSSVQCVTFGITWHVSVLVRGLVEPVTQRLELVSSTKVKKVLCLTEGAGHLFFWLAVPQNKKLWTAGGRVHSFLPQMPARCMFALVDAQSRKSSMKLKSVENNVKPELRLTGWPFNPLSSLFETLGLKWASTAVTTYMWEEAENGLFKPLLDGSIFINCVTALTSSPCLLWTNNDLETLL